jgi:hypothetical protein
LTAQRNMPLVTETIVYTVLPDMVFADRRRGWSEGKIQRWIDERDRPSRRQTRLMREHLDARPDDVQSWMWFLRTVVGSGYARYVSLMVQDDVAEWDPGSYESVDIAPAALKPADLLQMRSAWITGSPTDHLIVGRLSNPRRDRPCSTGYFFRERVARTTRLTDRLATPPNSPAGWLGKAGRDDRNLGCVRCHAKLRSLRAACRWTTRSTTRSVEAIAVLSRDTGSPVAGLVCGSRVSPQLPKRFPRACCPA